MIMEFSSFAFQLCNSDHDLANFTCGRESMDSYVKGEAVSEQQQSMATTTVVLDGNRVVAYFTLAADSLRGRKVHKRYQYRLARGAEDEYPAVSLHRLAIAREYQHSRNEHGLSLARYLLLYIVGLLLEMTDTVGIRYILINAYSDKVDLYKKLGFELNEEPPTGKAVTVRFVSMRLDLYPHKKIRDAQLGSMAVANTGHTSI